MCNDNRSHAKEMVISVTFKYIISLPCRLSRQPMASKQIPDGSRIAYSRRSYHLVTWQEALDIIIYLYRVILRVKRNCPPSSSDFFRLYHFPFFRALYLIIYARDLYERIPLLRPKQT